MGLRDRLRSFKSGLSTGKEAAAASQDAANSNDMLTLSQLAAAESERITTARNASSDSAPATFGDTESYLNEPHSKSFPIADTDLRYGSGSETKTGLKLTSYMRGTTGTPSYGSAGAAGSFADAHASFASTNTDFDYLTSPGAEVEADAAYQQAVALGLIPPMMPGANSLSGSSGLASTNSHKSKGAVTSFGSGKAASSFNSAATDFDYLTSPGAQAERNAEYQQQVMMNAHHMASMMAQGGAPAGYPPGMPPPPWATFNPALAGSFNPALAGGGFGADFPTPGPQTPADLQLKAAELDMAATQLMAAAERAKAAAAQARTEAFTGDQSGTKSTKTEAKKATKPSAKVAAKARAKASDARSAEAASHPRDEPMSVPLPSSKPDAKATTEKEIRAAEWAAWQGSPPPAISSTAEPVPDSARTTVMLRNLPHDYTRDVLLELLDQEGFRGTFDFVYLPMDFKRKAGLGYAFVNMLSHEEAERAHQHFQDFSTWKFASDKACQVAWGEPLQGLAQHIDRYRNSPVMHEDVPDEFKPVLYEGGVRVQFPPPTRRIRLPRVKCRCPNEKADNSVLEATAD